MVSLVFLIAAFVLFLIAALGATGKFNLIAAGLACLVLAHLVGIVSATAVAVAPLVFLIAALILFIIAAAGATSEKFNIIAAGLACMVLAQLVGQVWK